MSRPELADHNAKHLWVKAQMEHARGATQAQQVSATAAPKWDRDGDVSMGAVLEVASSRSANAQEHLCCGTSKENVPSLQLVAIGMASRW